MDAAPYKVSEVGFTDAVIEPLTMVVEFVAASVALTTMLRELQRKKIALHALEFEIRLVFL